MAGFLFFAKVRSVNAQLGDFVPVLVASQTIQPRTTLTGSMLEIKQVPKKYAFNSSLLSLEQTKGQMTLVQLQKGDVITKSMLKNAEQGSLFRLVNLTQSERVMFDEKMDATDKVDIVVSYQEGDKPVTKLLLEDVQVGKIAGDKERLTSIALELSMEDAQKLIFMQNFARQIRVLKHAGSPVMGR